MVYLAALKPWGQAAQSTSHRLDLFHRRSTGEISKAVRF